MVFGGASRYASEHAAIDDTRELKAKLYKRVNLRLSAYQVQAMGSARFIFPLVSMTVDRVAELFVPGVSGEGSTKTSPCFVFCWMVPLIFRFAFFYLVPAGPAK